jgi:probable phosphoglycerate mutase
MKIYLTRHGQNEDNLNGILNGHRDLPLTDLGKEQAKNLAEHLKKEGATFDLVLSSPLSRAYQTAEIITDTLGLTKPEKEELLIERNFGVMSGRNVEDVAMWSEKENFEHAKTDTITYFLNPAGAETFTDLLERAKKLLKKIQENFSDKKEILLVGHGDFGKMIYCEFYNLNWRDVLFNFHFGNSEVLILEKDLKEEDRFYFKQKQHNH